VTTDDRRRAILHCAARLFSHYGQSKTTVADIAREAQVGIGTVYLVFPSKEAIVEELSSTAHVRVLEAMREVAETRAGDSFSERLAGVLETRVAMFQRLAEEGHHACELVHCKSGPVKGVHAKFREDERLLLKQILEQATATGELASLDVTRAARSTSPGLQGSFSARTRRCLRRGSTNSRRTTCGGRRTRCVASFCLASSHEMRVMPTTRTKGPRAEQRRRSRRRKRRASAGAKGARCSSDVLRRGGRLGERAPMPRAGSALRGPNAYGAARVKSESAR
jgi:AcrR family transcriptional regulator